MLLNYIWIAFFLVSFFVAIVKLVLHFVGYPEFGGMEIFPALINATFEASELSVIKIALPLIGIMTLWLGLMKIGEKAGAIGWLAKIVNPFFSRLFPEIPKEHPAYGNIIMNFSANMLGLDNAATPLGLKAMQSLQELNLKKDTASNAQIMFLVLNTSGLTLIPISIMMQRKILGAADASDIFIPILIATYCATLVGILSVALWQKINLLDKVLFGWIAGITIFIGGIIWHLSTLTQEQIAVRSSFAGNFILFGIIVAFLIAAMQKKINVYEAFIDGAKTGFETSIKIIPYLVAMLVGIAVFRASGAMDMIVHGIAYCVQGIGGRTEFVDALPTAFMKPLSGSGARAMMIETMKTYGADSFTGRLSCIFQGATDTTFYIIALYFGSVGIKKTRYAVAGGLIADLAGVIAAILVVYLFFSPS
ncbi:MAG: nucleoside recognition domain-containing protein [Bacteroidota bacterium]